MNVEGLTSHIFITSGLVLTINSISSVKESQQKSTPLIAVFLPLILIFLYLGIYRLIDKNLLDLFPYVAPFSSGLQNAAFHFRSTTLVGLILIILNTINKLKFSHIIINTEK